MGKFKITKDTKNIHCRVRIGDNPEADGTILRQKASKRFLVTDGKHTGLCTIVDLEDNALLANTMTLTMERQDGTLQRAEYLSNKFAMGFDKKRFIINGATTDAHENATVLTDEAKAKLSKPAIKKVAKKKAEPKVKKEIVAKAKTAVKVVDKKKATSTKKNTVKTPKKVSTFKLSKD